MCRDIPIKHIHYAPAASFTGARVAPSTNGVRGATPSRPLCGLVYARIRLRNRPKLSRLDGLLRITRHYVLMMYSDYIKSYSKIGRGNKEEGTGGVLIAR